MFWSGAKKSLRPLSYINVNDLKQPSTIFRSYPAHWNRHHPWKQIRRWFEQVVAGLVAAGGPANSTQHVMWDAYWNQHTHTPQLYIYIIIINMFTPPSKKSASWDLSLFKPQGWHSATWGVFTGSLWPMHGEKWRGVFWWPQRSSLEQNMEVAQIPSGICTFQGCFRGP